MIRLPVYVGVDRPTLAGCALSQILIVALPTQLLADCLQSLHWRAYRPGYVVIFIVAYDYSRWVSSWGVCMFLIMHAHSAAAVGYDERAIRRSAPTTLENLVLGWIVTVIPRVGVTIPF